MDRNIFGETGGQMNNLRYGGLKMMLHSGRLKPYLQTLTRQERPATDEQSSSLSPLS
jgi:hypothetical protein